MRLINSLSGHHRLLGRSKAMHEYPPFLQLNTFKTRYLLAPRKQQKSGKGLIATEHTFK
jgi:hypothetical protein